MDKLHDTQSGELEGIPECTSTVSLHIYRDRNYSARNTAKVVAPDSAALRLLMDMVDYVRHYLQWTPLNAFDKYAITAQVHLRRPNNIPLDAETGLCKTFFCFSSDDLLSTLVADH